MEKISSMYPGLIYIREVIIKKKMKVCILSKVFQTPPLPPKVWTKNRIKFFRDQIKQFYQNEIQKVWIGGLTPPPLWTKYILSFFFFNDDLPKLAFRNCYIIVIISLSFLVQSW